MISGHPTCFFGYLVGRPAVNEQISLIRFINKFCLFSFGCLPAKLPANNNVANELHREQCTGQPVAICESFSPYMCEPAHSRLRFTICMVLSVLFKSELVQYSCRGTDVEGFSTKKLSNRKLWIVSHRHDNKAHNSFADTLSQPAVL